MSEEAATKRGRPPRELGFFGTAEHREFMRVFDEWMTARNRWMGDRTMERRDEADKLREELISILKLADGLKVD